MDDKYKGGKNRPVSYLETAQRKNPTRPGRDDAPVITIKLSKEALQQLKSKNILKYDALIELVLEAVKSDQKIETKKVSKTQIDLIRNGDSDEIVDLIQPTPPQTPTPAPTPAPPPVRQNPQATRVTRQMAAQLRQLEDEPIGVRLRNRVAGRAR